MLFDGSMHQLPDTDPGETEEWLDSLDAVVEVQGKTRARYLLSRLLERAHASQVSFPATVSTPYVNSIPSEREPWFPGDEHLERRILRRPKMPKHDLPMCHLSCDSKDNG